MSADNLREAARVLRKQAEAAPRGPWRPMGAGHVVHSLTDRLSETVADTYPTGGSDRQRATTAYIATVGPDVGLALAQALDDHAHDHGSYDCNWEPCQLVVVARSILRAT